MLTHGWLHDIPGNQNLFLLGKEANHLENPPTLHSRYEFFKAKVTNQSSNQSFNHQSFTFPNQPIRFHHPGFLSTSASELNVFHNCELRSSQRRKRTECTVRLEEPVRVRKASTVSPNLVVPSRCGEMVDLAATNNTYINHNPQRTKLLMQI